MADESDKYKGREETSIVTKIRNCKQKINIIINTPGFSPEESIPWKQYEKAHKKISLNHKERDTREKSA